MPSDYPPEIHAKLIVVLLYLKASHLAKPLAQPLMALQVNEFGELMLDIVEAFMVQKQFQEALGIKN